MGRLSLGRIHWGPGFLSCSQPWQNWGEGSELPGPKDVQAYPGAAAAAKSLQSCPTLCDPIDGSPPGSPIPGILQARTLEWVAMPSSRGSS